MLRKVSWFFVAAFLVAITIVGMNGDMKAGYAFHDDMADAAATVVTALLAVTLFVERGMTVINAIIFGGAQRDAEDKIRQADAKGLDELSVVMAYKERMRLFGAFLAGLFVSAAGVRTLEGLFDPVAIKAAENALLHPVDVVLTAALIAGGSNGLAFLLQLAKDRLAPPPPVTLASAKGGGVKAGPAIGAATTTTAVAATAAAARSAADPNYRARLTTTG